jgi:hypothetical protein
MRTNDWRDHATRLLLVVAGVLAAAVFVARGEGEALPPLALGGVLGASMIRKFETDADDES